MKILGIDPALTSLGWAIIEAKPPKINYLAGGLVTTKSTEKMVHRLAFIANSIEIIIQEHQPTMVAMEETFINKNPISSLKLAYVRGLIMGIVGKYDLPFYEFLPNKIKKTLVGVGHAEKTQIKQMVKIVISHLSKDISSDEADAIAVAYTCLVYQNYSPGR